MCIRPPQQRPFRPSPRSADSRRWGDPEDLIGTAIFLASKASEYITGQTVYVDGGWLAAL